MKRTTSNYKRLRKRLMALCDALERTLGDKRHRCKKSRMREHAKLITILKRFPQWRIL